MIPQISFLSSPIMESSAPQAFYGPGDGGALAMGDGGFGTHLGLGGHRRVLRAGGGGHIGPLVECDHIPALLRRLLLPLR